MRKVFNTELIEEFLTALRVELNRSENTIKGYRKDLMVFKDFVLQEKKKSVPLAELTANLLGHISSTWPGSGCIRPGPSGGTWRP
jgi:site-specific recombinase XerD